MITFSMFSVNLRYDIKYLSFKVLIPVALACTLYQSSTIHLTANMFSVHHKAEVLFCYVVHIFFLSGLVKRKTLVLDLDETLIHSHVDG